MFLDTSISRKSFKHLFLEIFIPLIFILLGLYAAFNHSLWRDEMQGWLVAWRSESWVDLWKNNAPSGHPILWSALVYLVRDITGTPLSMQLLHWFLGSCAIICFWRWNPFPFWQKALFTFGYYPFWEYYFVCRFYVLAELLTFIFCSCYPLRRKTYLPFAICIGLLSNTHAFSWSLTFALFMTLLVDWLTNPKQRSKYLENKNWRWDFSLSLILIIVLCAFSAFSLLQVRDSVDVIPSELNLRHFFRVLGRVFGGYMLIIPNHNRWIDLIFCGFITVGLISATISFLKRNISALSLYISGLIFLFVFNYFIYLGVGSRHYGYYFLILIASLWIALHPSESNKNYRIKFNSFSFFSKKLYMFFPYLFTFCLSIHLAAGLHRSLYDFYLPYSAGKVTANYIKDKGWSDEVIFGTRDVEVATVSGYLDRDIYYPELKGFGSYAQWKNRIPIESKDTISQLHYFLSLYPETQRFLLILSRGYAFRDLEPGDEFVNDNIRIVADQKFERSWINPERFYLYWVETYSSERVNK